MTTAVSGRAPLIWVAAAMPLPGMLMSSRQTSGRSRLAPSTAPAASAASTQTWKSPVRSSARAHQGAGPRVVVGQQDA